MTAYRSLASWRGDGPFGAWLTRIAVRHRAAPGRAATVRHVARHRRTRRRRSAPIHRRPILRIRPGHAWPCAPSGRPTSGPPSPALPEPYREVVVLRFFGELSLDEIARQTERPLGTVKTHLHRGLLRLRATVESGDDA